MIIEINEGKALLLCRTDGEVCFKWYDVIEDESECIFTDSPKEMKHKVFYTKEEVDRICKDCRK